MIVTATSPIKSPIIPATCFDMTATHHRRPATSSHLLA